MVTSEEILNNLRAQTDMLLASLAEIYESGQIEDPRQNHLMMSLFSLVCEGKVEGSMDEELTPPRVKWTLTPAYAKQMKEEQEAIKDPNVIKGPW